MDVKLGDKIKCRIQFGMEGGGLLPAVEGTVVYIHPERRFYTLEFTFPGREPGEVRRFRESYLFPPEPIEPEHIPRWGWAAYAGDNKTQEGKHEDDRNRKL